MAKKIIVQVEISRDQEYALMERYGRKCSTQSLIERAIAEAASLTTPWQKPERKKRDSKADESVVVPTPGVVGTYQDSSL